jgi:hypothetical protein
MAKNINRHKHRLTNGDNGAVARPSPTGSGIIASHHISHRIQASRHHRWPSLHQSWCHYNVIAAVAVVLTTANVAVSASSDSAVVAAVVGFGRCCCSPHCRYDWLPPSLGICVIAKNAKKILLENGKNITRHKQGFTYQCPLILPSKKRKDVRIFSTRTNKKKTCNDHAYQ